MQSSNPIYSSQDLLQKTRESRRLAIARLAHTEESLQAVHAQQERLRTFIGINAEMEKEQKHLYEVNKQQASLQNERQALERFETFEAVNNRFQRIHTLSQSLAERRNEQTQMGIQLAEMRRYAEEEEKRGILENEKLQEAYDAVTQTARTMAEAERLNALSGSAQNVAETFTEQYKRYSQRLEMLQKLRREADAQTEEKQKKLTELLTQRQTLEAYKHMLQQEKGVLSQLEEMQIVRESRDRLTRLLHEATQRQDEQNERLSHLYNQHERLKDYIASRQEEIDSHRRSNAGKDSYNLQRRALELRGRKLLLGRALSLWSNMAASFERIEQKEQVVTALRLRSEHLNRRIDTLTEELRRLRQQLELRTYQWTISKSENVIELRGDLQEGTPCAVCGATHHPWHSESMNEQNSLIASLKTDCDILSRDILAKENNLHEAEMELTAIRAKIEVETENLQMLNQRQEEDKAEWAHFATLDHSMNECSRTTNREARTAIIRQLIEKTSVDADEAEKELNAFTFHLDAISNIGLEQQKKQKEASELAIHLNEVNTACQVMASEVDRLSQQLAATNNDYSRRYKTLEHLINLPEWYRKWKASPEGLKLRIQEMAQRWSTLERDISQLTHDTSLLTAQSNLIQQYIQQTTQDLTRIESLRAKTDEQASKAKSALEKLLPRSDGKTIFAQAMEALDEQKACTNQARETYLERLREYINYETLSQHIQQDILTTEQHIADERREMDIWMRQYNANHPPVQFAELERLLADGQDWNDIRQRVRTITIDHAVTQARVDKLRAQIIALQAAGLRPFTDRGESEQEQLHVQQKELEQQRRETLRQIVHYDALIDAHEKSMQAYA